MQHFLIPIKPVTPPRNDLQVGISKLVWVFALVVMFFFLSPTAVQAAITPGDPNNFITVWRSNSPGVSASNQIRIPGTGSGYNYDLYWESVASSSVNGTILGITSNTRTITFPAPGTYRVEIAGSFPRIYFNYWYSGDSRKLRYIEQWGNIAWTSFERAFADTFGGSWYLSTDPIVTATDTPNLINTPNLNFIFDESYVSMNDSVNNWDVSNYSNMSYVFGSAKRFNSYINDWNVSNVTNMDSMFSSAYKFNQPLNNWDTSKVVNMSKMFSYATAFNQPLNSWNVASVTNMTGLFSYATAFNQPLNSWNVTKVDNMSIMFQGASAFNQSLTNWNTASTTNFSSMFYNAKNFNQSLATFDISSVQNMSGMLSGTTLSEANLDATLISFANQATTKNITNIPLGLGVATYSAAGASAINTLQSLGWTITEQRSATYRTALPATISNANQIINPNSTTSPVTVSYPPTCTFLGWSDGNTDNPRQDIITDNLEVTALVDCDPVSPGTFNIKQTINNEIALSIGSSLTLSPSIPGVTGGVSSGELPFNVKTNNSLGYQVSLSFAQVVPFRHLLSPSSYIFNYVPQVVGVPDYEAIVPNKSHSFAYSVFSPDAAQKFRHSGSTCGVGGSNTFGKCWFNQANARTPVTIVERNSATGVEGATSTLQFRVMVDQNPVPALPSGEYQATVTVTVLPL